MITVVCWGNASSQDIGLHVNLLTYFNHNIPTSKQKFTIDVKAELHIYTQSNSDMFQ